MTSLTLTNAQLGAIAERTKGFDDGDEITVVLLDSGDAHVTCKDASGAVRVDRNGEHRFVRTVGAPR